jgi:hypothetical protein
VPRVIVVMLAAVGARIAAAVAGAEDRFRRGVWYAFPPTLSARPRKLGGMLRASSSTRAALGRSR